MDVFDIADKGKELYRDFTGRHIETPGDKLMNKGASLIKKGASSVLQKALSRRSGKGAVTGTGTGKIANSTPSFSAPTKDGQDIESYRDKVKGRITGFLNKLWEAFKLIVIKGPIRDILKHLAKWIALIIVIIIVFKGISYSSNNTRRTAAYSNNTSNQSVTSKISSYMKSMSTSLNGITSPLGKKATNGIPRESQSDGRCDDIEWVSMGGTINDKNIGLCFQSSIEKPTSIRWIIDPSNLYEYDMLPSAIKEKIQNDTNKLMVTIPYMNKGSSYVLSCKDAVYEDGTTAKDLFVDEGDTYCKLKSKDLDPSYKYTSQYRAWKSSNDYQGLDVYKTV